MTAVARVEAALMLPTEGPEAAKAAGLRYTTDAIPGIRRQKRRGGFTFVGPDGKPITDKGEIARIKALADPAGLHRRLDLPARERPPAGDRPRRPRPQAVPLPQALARGPRREQVRPHDRVRESAAGDPRGGRARPRALRHAAREGAGDDRLADGAHRDSHRQRRVCARERLLRADHAARGARRRAGARRSRFHFRGKSGKEHEVQIRDKRIARIIKRSQDLPGQQLFEYLDDEGTARPVRSEDVNEYLRDHQRRRLHGEGFPNVGSHRDVRAGAGRAASRRRRTRPSERSSSPRSSRRSPSISATRRRSARSRTSSRASSTSSCTTGALELVEKAVAKASPHALDRHESAVVALIERIVSARERAARRRAGEVGPGRACEAQASTCPQESRM